MKNALRMALEDYLETSLAVADEVVRIGLDVPSAQKLAAEAGDARNLLRREWEHLVYLDFKDVVEATKRLIRVLTAGQLIPAGNLLIPELLADEAQRSPELQSARQRVYEDELASMRC